VQEVVAKARDGVLFIDEAYALADEAEYSYGTEAIETLLKLMEDHRDDLVVIVAGYTQRMEVFPGCESRPSFALQPVHPFRRLRSAGTL
jgi:SpoVK/Ycf46/Vps4 family AAA+-type ATPase